MGLMRGTDWIFIRNSGQWLLYVTPGLTFTNSTFCPHTVFMGFVWIWEQTAIISLYNINWLVFRTETECVYCAVRTGSIYIIQASGHYMYHHFNLHKFYVLPTQCIYVFCVDLRTNSDYFPIQHWLAGFYNRDGVCLLRGTDWIFIRNSGQWLLYVPPGLTFTNSTFCPHSVFMCFVWISEQTAIISLYSINWLVFIAEMVWVYCAVRTEYI